MVNERTRDRIRDIARRLDYTVDKNASNLRTQQTRTLALLFFEDPTPDESNINPFFMSMQGWIARVCSERGYDLLLSFQRMSRNWHAEYTGSHVVPPFKAVGCARWNHREIVDGLSGGGKWNCLKGVIFGVKQEGA